MEGLGLDIPDIAVQQALPSGIPGKYLTESSDFYLTEDGSGHYTTEG